MDKIKTGIIGIGKVSRLHAKALESVESAKFTALWCRNLEITEANRFAKSYGVKCYTDIDDMIRTGGVEAVIIATPHPYHAEPTIKALKAGAHVIVEKPMASSLEDCDAMIRTAKETGKKLAVISQRRLYAPVQRIRRAIDDGKLGEPILGTVTMLGWRDQKYYQSDPWRGKWKEEGGGVLVNQAPHQIDLLQWYMGPIEELYGRWANLNHPYIEVEDTSIALIRFMNGAIGNILVSNSQNPALYGKVAVFGKNGAAAGVQTDGGAMFVAGMSTITEPPINDLWTIPGEQEKLKQWQKEDADFFASIDATTYYHRLQFQDFMEAILKDRDPMITGEEGRKTVEIFTAIYRSQRDHKPIRFPLAPEFGKDMDGRLP